jgi:hypothetical protein
MSFKEKIAKNKQIDADFHIQAQGKEGFIVKVTLQRFENTDGENSIQRLVKKVNSFAIDADLSQAQDTALERAVVLLGEV